MENQIHGEDWRVTRHGTTAYIGASHGQFLISRRVIEAIPHHRFNQALATKDDYYFDSTIEEAGFMRLSVDKPMVYHIGNVIQEDWLKKEYRRLIDNASVAVTPVQNLQQVYTGVHPHWFWGRWRVQQILRAIYAWAFKTYFENA